MVYNQTLMLSELPEQPLPKIEPADAVFVTIWLASSIVFSIIPQLSCQQQPPQSDLARVQDNSNGDLAARIVSQLLVCWTDINEPQVVFSCDDRPLDVF
jgi:hypothetical protein